MKWINRASKVAQKSTFNKRFRHGAVLVKGGSVINEGFNSINYSRFYHKFSDWGIEHAEASSLYKVSKDKSVGSTIYVVRINCKNELCFSKPCLGCIKFAKFCGVKKIVYSIDKDTIGSMKIL